ncbi:MBG domain-containing protein, partial [Marinoscillum sp.]|uniref:MBG domain-containing protein n=1 Tax=Marinoscillum sp. TaxID=2024838 RepID=UPI0032F3A661
DQAFDLTATASSELTVTFTSSDETIASVSGNTVTIMGAGTATITASQAGNDNYSAALDVSQSLTIEKATQTISFEPLANRTYGDQAFDLTATASSELTVTFTSSDETIASVSGNTVTIMGAGTATITASQAGNDNYNAALDVAQSLTIEKATQTIRFEALANRTYGDQAFELMATGGASGQTVTFTSSDETVASVSGSTVTIMGAGIVTITASQAGDDNHGVASDVSQNLIIGKASLMVSAGDASRVYGAVNPVFTIGYQGFIGDDSEADLEAVPSASTLATQTSDVGTYAITVSGGADQNYVFDYTEGILIINKALATITLAGLSQTADGTAKSPTVTTDPAALNYSITFDGSSTLPTQAGTYAVEVTVLETNYEGSASGSFVLTKAVALGALPMVNEVKVYPNPATERLTVSGDDGLIVKIYDISGVLQIEHKTNQTIAVDSLPAGVYLIQVSDPNGRMVSHQRVVKY